MKKARRISLFLVLIFLPVWGFSQELETGELDLKTVFVETALDESQNASLIIDNTRTKVGKDFYDLFYKHWSSQQAVADTSQNRAVLPVIPADEVLITIEELPTPGSGNLIQISLDDQPVWQQFVQARYELLEVDAAQAVEFLRENFFR